MHTSRGSNKKERRLNPPAYLGLGALKRPVKSSSGYLLTTLFLEHFTVFDRVMSSHSLCILLISLVMNSDVSAVWINYTLTQLDTVHAYHLIWLQHQKKIRNFGERYVSGPFTAKRLDTLVRSQRQLMSIFFLERGHCACWNVIVFFSLLQFAFFQFV